MGLGEFVNVSLNLPVDLKDRAKGALEVSLQCLECLPWVVQIYRGNSISQSIGNTTKI